MNGVAPLSAYAAFETDDEVSITVRVEEKGDLTAEPYYRTNVYEFNAIGKLLASYKVPASTHHDIRELPNGNLLVATNLTSTSKSEDVIIEIDRDAGYIVNTWDISNYIPKNAGTSLLDTEDYWFHNNSLYLAEKNEQLIVSGRHRDVVIAEGRIELDFWFS